MDISETWLDSPREKNTIQNYPSIQRNVHDILELSYDIYASETDVIKLEKKLSALIRSIRKCLRTPEWLHGISDVFNSAMQELQSREKVRKIYGVFPLDL